MRDISDRESEMESTPELLAPFMVMSKLTIYFTIYYYDYYFKLKRQFSFMGTFLPPQDFFIVIKHWGHF